MAETNNQIEQKVGFFKNITDFLFIFGPSIVIAGLFAGVTGSIAWSIVQPQSYVEIALSTHKTWFGIEYAGRGVHVPTIFNWADVTRAASGFGLAHIFGFTFFYPMNNYQEYRNLVFLKMEDRIRRVLITWVPILAAISGLCLFAGVLGASHKSTYDIAYENSQDEQGLSKQVFDQLGGNSSTPKDIALKLDSEKEISKINFKYEKYRDLGYEHRKKYFITMSMLFLMLQYYIWGILLSNILRKEFKAELEGLQSHSQ